MKTKIHGKMYEIKIIPRELTAVLFTEDEPFKDTDNAFMLFNCPLPTKEKDLKEIKKKAVEKAETNFNDFVRYLECNKVLHTNEGEK